MADLDEIGLFEVLYTDFTEIFYTEGRQKAQFVPILAHTSRMCLGWTVGESANHSLAMKAWEEAKEQLRQ